MTLFFTSDQHFHHKGALRFGLRQDFESVEEMNETMIAMHNSVVQPQDTVYYLGDFSFGKPSEAYEVLCRLNGKKIWVPGNHDTTLLKDEYICSEFSYISPLIDQKFGRQRVTMCHYPMLTWNKAHYGAWMLHGHSHGNCSYPSPHHRIMDVGVDTNNFKPYSYEEIEAIMTGPDKGYTAMDHHKEKPVDGNDKVHLLGYDNSGDAVFGTDKCKVDSYSSRICELGTKSCVIYHKEKDSVGNQEAV